MEAIAPIDNLVKDVENKLGKKLEITSSIRTPQSQAKAMLPHFQSNSDTLRSYAPHKKPLIEEINKAYKLGVANGESNANVIGRMSSVIERQVFNNQLISNHLTNSARDLRTKGLNSQEVSRLITLLKANPQLVVLDETKTVSPHIHIHLK